MISSHICTFSDGFCMLVVISDLQDVSTLMEIQLSVSSDYHRYKCGDTGFTACERFNECNTVAC